MSTKDIYLIDSQNYFIHDMTDTVYNDTLATATQLGVIGGDGNWANKIISDSVGHWFVSATSAVDPVDFFSFTTPEKASFRLETEVRSPSFDSYLIIGIYNSSGTAIDSTIMDESYYANGETSLFFDVNKNETYYVGVRRFSGAASAPVGVKTLVNYNFDLAKTNFHPNGVLLYDLKSSYKVGSTININELYFGDRDGWQDIKGGTFAIYNKATDSLVNQDINMTFEKWSGGTDWAKAKDVSISLGSAPAGEYYAIAYGYDSRFKYTEQFRRDFEIVNNTTPSSVYQYDLKDAYSSSETIDFKQLYVLDLDGWSDVQSISVQIGSKTASTTSFTRWEGADTSATASNLSVSLAGLQTGTYDVNFLATDKSGSTASLTKKISVTGISNSNTDTGNNNSSNTGGGNNNSGNTGSGNNNSSKSEPTDIIGTDKSELLVGNFKDNLVWGKQGNDTLTGDAGADRFLFDIGTRFSRRQIGLDKITDLQVGVDKIVIDKSTFRRANKIGFAKNEFQAQIKKESIVYVKSKGAIYYNENGKRFGFGVGGAFATVTPNLPLTAADFQIVA